MVFAAVLAALPCACAGEEPFSDPAKPVEAAPCADFTITLESNKTTGFGWDIAEPFDEKVAEFVSCEYVAADTALVGAPGREIWAFRAVCPGKTVISFKYFRPWEKDVPPARKMEFTVIVKQEAPCSDQR
jgi:inhibitor of cysteine peptidase